MCTCDGLLLSLVHNNVTRHYMVLVRFLLLPSVVREPCVRIGLATRFPTLEVITKRSSLCRNGATVRFS